MKAFPLVLIASLAALPAAAQTVVPVDRFDSIQLEGGGHVTLVHGATQQVKLIRGSTQYTRFHAKFGQPRKLVIEACNKDCPQQYDLEVEITTPDLESVAIEGGGHIESRGAFPGQQSITVAIDGGGNIDIRSIEAVSATAAIDGGGHVKLTARDNLTAAIDGGGHVEYWGNPKNVTRVVDGGGDVSKGS
jgi:Putative auto-transporter adhesin, head GIN domain